MTADLAPRGGNLLPFSFFFDLLPFQVALQILHRKKTEKNAKIKDFGLPNPSQNLPKTLSQNESTFVPPKSALRVPQNVTKMMSICSPGAPRATFDAHFWQQRGPSRNTIIRKRIACPTVPGDTLLRPFFLQRVT